MRLSKPGLIIRRVLQTISRRIADNEDPAIRLRRQYPDHEFGRGTYGNLVVREWGEGARLKVGNFCSIASGVQIFLGGEHRSDWITTYPFSELWHEASEFRGHPKTKGDVSIGNDVWIGEEAVILSGISIGNGAIIGARTVLARSVPPYAIVAGNPAQTVRMRFAEETITRLEATRWWDWSDEALRHAFPDLLSSDLAIFLRRAESGYYFTSEPGS